MSKYTTISIRAVCVALVLFLTFWAYNTYVRHTEVAIYTSVNQIPTPASSDVSVPTTTPEVISTSTTTTTLVNSLSENATGSPVRITPSATPTLAIPKKNTAGALPTPELVAAAPSEQKTLKWGVFTGSNPTAIEKFDTYVSYNPDYLAFFVHWGNGAGELPKFLKTYADNRDRTLVIFWESSDYTKDPINQPEYSYSTILEGEWDEYLGDFAEQLKRYKGEVILVPFSEMNGNWNAWSGTMNGNAPEKAVLAYQYVHRFFTDIENVKFGWAPNSISVPLTYENRIEAYYPGDAYVDYVGVDGFNKGTPWYSFSEIFGSALETISQYKKPIIIFSFASAEGPRKAEWMKDAFYTQMPKYPLLHGWVWFNQNKEHNWLVWSDEDALAVFLNAVKK